MGTEVYFRHRVNVADIQHSMLFDEDEFIESFGYVHFSGFTMRFQQKVYGIDYADCITYGPEATPEDPESELVGDPNTSGDTGGWYTPDWDRAVVRVERLIAACESTDNAHRKEYDREGLLRYRELILQCANHPDRQNCQVMIG